ncbi:MAG: hypothetical protein IKM25_03150 [Clostridia bacterium]|nr:hypothetical protein [Clostridia bacterium]MBR6785226.1 hypothetical protein [Clostridia bacterium]
MKKIISILLAMLMIMPFAVPFASAADAIGTIAVTIETDDLGGKSVDSYADYVTIGTEGVIFEESNGPAVEAFNKTTESYDSEFEGGNYYIFTVKLTEAPYYALPAAGSFAEVEVNGSKYAAMVQEKSTGSGTISYISLEVELYVGDPMKNLKAIDFHVPAPVAGAVPADLSQVTADNMGVIIIGIEWFPEDPVFVEGTQYTFQLALETAEGFTFDKNIYLSHDMADAVKIGSGKNELKMSYTFPAIPEKTKITEINATVVEPVAGETPSDVVATTGTGYTVALYDWYHLKDLMGTITEFEGGNTYHVQVIFTPESGYVFADDVTATINGKAADLRLSNSNTGAKIFDLGFAQLPVPEYDISVTNGTASASKAVAGTTITLTADAAPTGKVFDKWVVTGATVADSSSATTTFAMPKNDVTAEATYKDKTYNVAVANGTASVSKAVAGTTVTLTANAAPAGKVFDKWVITGATVADTSKATTTFTMPENNVTAEATYKNVVYKVTVTNGKASASTAVMGDSITFTANQIDGKVFSHWEISGAAVADKNAKETTVTVGTSDVTAEAIYEDCPCKCHQGGIAGFFYKIVLFFQKLFGKNTICEFCGAKH